MRIGDDTKSYVQTVGKVELADTPMTTAGDLITTDASTLTRLANPNADNYLLGSLSTGAKIAWFATSSYTRTFHLDLPLAWGVSADGTGSENTAMPITKTINSGTQTSNAPKLSFESLGDMADASEYGWFWTFMLPPNWSSGGTLRLFWWSTATTGNAVWKAAPAPVTTNSTDIDSGNTIFNTVTTSSADAVAGTSGLTKESTIALTTTNFAASRLCFLFASLDGGDASNTIASARIAHAVLEYTGKVF